MHVIGLFGPYGYTGVVRVKLDILPGSSFLSFNASCAWQLLGMTTYNFCGHLKSTIFLSLNAGGIPSTRISE